MIIIPAIDILDGRCVRLKRGDYSTAHDVAGDPLETAKLFINKGARLLHIVDLNGAREGKLCNSELISQIIALPDANVEIGGGIRNMATVDYYMKLGAKRVVIGSAAVKDPGLVNKACVKYPGAIVVGADTKADMISVNGWTSETSINVLDFIIDMKARGASGVVYTEIEKDGMLSGINAGKYKCLADKTGMVITASGGIRDISDIIALKEAGVFGAICGKSIYSGTLDLSEAIKICEESPK